MASRQLVLCLFLLCVVLVALAPDQSSRENTWIRFYDYPVGIAFLQAGYRNFRFDEPVGSFKEHQSNRNAKELLWADRACSNIRAATVFFVSRMSVRPIGIQGITKPLSTKGMGMQDIPMPACRPPNCLNEPSSLTERKVDACNPGALPAKELLKPREVRPFL